MHSAKDKETKTDIFMEEKPRLMGIAYRMLGSNKDAEDLVHDVYLKLLNQDLNRIQNPSAWLTTVCTRRCLDFMKSAAHSRVDYVGPWLPEPISDHSAGQYHMELSATLSTAFLLMLERLSPKERAVFLLREIFGHDYALVADTINLSEANCRKILSRAKEKLGQKQKRYSVDAQMHHHFFAAFKASIEQGDTGNLKKLLSEEVALAADGGGKASAVKKEVVGTEKVARFIEVGLHHYWKGKEWSFQAINGQPGAVILDENGHIHASITLGNDNDGRINDIWIMRNPEKLASFSGN